MSGRDNSWESRQVTEWWCVLSGRSQVFTCEVVGYHGGGAPTIHWYTVTRDGLTNSPESQWDPISKKSSITFTPEVEDDGKEIGCRNPESGQVSAEAEEKCWQIFMTGGQRLSRRLDVPGACRGRGVCLPGWQCKLSGALTVKLFTGDLRRRQWRWGCQRIPARTSSGSSTTATSSSCRTSEVKTVRTMSECWTCLKCCRPVPTNYLNSARKVLGRPRQDCGGQHLPAHPPHQGGGPGDGDNCFIISFAFRLMLLWTTFWK